MAQKKSRFVSAFDVCARVFKALSNAVSDAGGSDEDLRRLETDPELRKKIGALMMDGKKVVGNLFKVVVDYSKSRAEMISAGKYDRKNDDINEKHFPSDKRGDRVELNMKLRHFNRWISSEDAISEFKKAGERPATQPEFRAFIAANPGELRKYPIVLLGFWGGVPCAWLVGGEWDSSLYWCGFDWHGDCRFLVVCES
ncbi:MAG: hypothetical protein HYT03_02835 [Candidatus Harrisonbacteria bacterium]|nr:hypothetical protein [Candidatus Harrisonbacteria bacterium]